MGAVELINSLTWPAAFAIVGSVVTIMVTLLGYLLKVRTATPTPPTNDGPAYTQLIHDRISETKDLTQENNKEIGVLQSKVEALQKEVDSDRSRDERDFTTLNMKYEKLLSIVMKMLQDEKL